MVRTDVGRALQEGTPSGKDIGCFSREWRTRYIHHRCGEASNDESNHGEGRRAAPSRRGPCPSKKLERIAKRTHVLVDQASARLRADFAADLVRGEFRCFDLPQMRAAVASKDPNAARKAIYKQAVNHAAAAKLCQGSALFLKF